MENVFYIDRLAYLAFPLNLIAGILLVGVIIFLYVYYRENRFVKWLGGMQGTLWITGGLIFVLLGEGILAGRWFCTWPFVCLLLVLWVNLGLVVLRHIRSCSLRNVLFLLNHLGLWLALGGALLGAPDRKSVKLVAYLRQPEYTAVDEMGRLYPLPFTVTLEKFQVEYYDRMHRVPRKFRSELILQNKACRQYTAVEVNEPASFGGYSIYQDNYDREKGLYSVLLLVRDPWLGIVYTGIVMMIMGAVGLVVYGPLRRSNQ